MAARLRIATRASALARWQAAYVASLLGGGVEVVAVKPLGDRDKATPLRDLAGRGIFVKEVQMAVLDGRADIAVHAAKDLPSTPGVTGSALILAAVPTRADPSDVLVGRSLEALARGATVATGSPRRRVQLARLRPDLQFIELRGNIPTRLRKIPAGGAAITAAAALHRLGLAGRIAQVLDPATFVPQVGQGALAVECRADDEPTLSALVQIEHGPSRLAVDAERAWLAVLGGGCDFPVGAHAVVDGDQITMTAMIALADGRNVSVGSRSGVDPVTLGEGLAHQMIDAHPHGVG